MSESTRTAPASSPADDLAFLRALAESARDVPFSGGDYFIAGGAWFALASLVVWFGSQGLFGLSLPSAHLAFGIGGLGFAATLTYLLRRDRGQVETAGNRALGVAWTAIGWSIFAFVIGVALIAYRGQPVALATISLFVVSVYGIGWALAAAVTRQGWMRATAGFTFLTVPVLGALVGTGHDYLAYAIALVLIAVVPGFRLRAAARAARSSATAGA